MKRKEKGGLRQKSRGILSVPQAELSPSALIYIHSLPSRVLTNAMNMQQLYQYSLLHDLYSRLSQQMPLPN
jgi:hypothetical protein